MTDLELLREALEALTYTGPKYIYSDTIDALRARLATCDRCGKVNPAELHTCTPPQRKWVGLTDEEMMQSYVALKSVTGFYSLEKYARDIEAKLKEKNGG